MAILTAFYPIFVTPAPARLTLTQERRYDRQATVHHRHITKFHVTSNETLSAAAAVLRGFHSARQTLREIIVALTVFPCCSKRLSWNPPATASRAVADRGRISLNSAAHAVTLTRGVTYQALSVT